MKIAFIVAHDAYLKCAKNISSMLGDGIDISWFTTSSDLHDPDVNLVQIGIENEIHHSDFIFAGLGGRALNQLIHDVRNSVYIHTPKIISFFPGILHYRIFEALTSRLFCDGVLLNCKRDFELFNEISNSVFGYSRGVLFGAPWVEPNFPRAEIIDIDLLFVEQSIVPSSKLERTKLVKQLHDIAASNAQIKVVVKLRARKDSETSHKIKYCLEDICHREFPKLDNLLFSTEDVDYLLSRSHCMCTVSSSVAYTGFLSKRATFFVSDFGVQQGYGNDLFFDSGCFNSISEYADKPQPDAEWIKKYVYAPNEKALNWIFNEEANMSLRDTSVYSSSFFRKLHFSFLIAKCFFKRSYSHSRYSTFAEWKSMFRLLKNVR
jgi:hypothetical protein